MDMHRRGLLTAALTTAVGALPRRVYAAEGPLRIGVINDMSGAYSITGGRG